MANSDLEAAAHVPPVVLPVNGGHITKAIQYRSLDSDGWLG